ncbi:hypothetical protein L0222_04560 [bacterium]|nr:hypothetical protein [bacterium]MCI0604178.1 hypothetical protein [bacterium]
MKPATADRAAKALVVLLWIVILAFMVTIIIPGNPFFFAPRRFLYFSLTLALFKGFWDWHHYKRSRLLEVLPFLILFLFASFRVSRSSDYQFGVDDAYYYSYAASIFIDGDLELSNQYELSKLERHLDAGALAVRTPAGYSANIYPAGLSLYWTPFFVGGHLLANLFDLPMNGYSRPYTHTILIGHLFYVCAGLYFTYRFCNGFFSKLVSFGATATILFTTPYLYYYFSTFPLISEPLAFALIALFLFLAFTSERRHSRLRWFALGILFGTLTMVRLHNVVLGAVPVAVLYFSLPDEKKRSQFLQLFGVFIAGSLIGFLPQVIVWRVLNGEWFFSSGTTFLPYWKKPFVLETLFSARKGLFPWSPVVALSVTGLFVLIKRNRLWAWLLLAVVLATTWINSAQVDWWGAATVGSRRFVPLVSIFALGVAALFISLKKYGRLILLIFLLGLVFLNSFLVSSTVAGAMEAEHADRFSDVLQGPYSIFQPVVYGLQFPVQAAYRLRYGTPVYGPLTEFFIGEDVFYFQRRAGEEIFNAESPLFGEGWILENGVRKTNGAVSTLYVPLFLKDKPRIVVELDFLPAEKEKDIRIDFVWNGKLLRSRKILSDGRQVELPVRWRDYRLEVNKLEMRIYHSRSEEEAPSLVLQRIHFRPPLTLTEGVEDSP